MALSALKRKDEALKYAEMYPEKPSLDKKELIGMCLSGDERRKHDQEMVESRLQELLWQLNSMDNFECYKAAEDIIKIKL